MSNKWYPGQIFVEKGEIELFTNKPITEITVTNTDERTIQVGSHFHFFEANKALSFNRKEAYGKRLAILSGTAIRFEKNKPVEVTLIDLEGERTCIGFNNLVMGKLDDPKIKENALTKAKNEGFKGVSLWV